MKVILFKSALDDRSALVARHVTARTPPEQLVVCESLAQLVVTLPGHGIQNVLLVLLAESQECLSALHSQLDLLRQYRLILVLPDEDQATVSMGHKFHPRFLTTLDQEPEHLGAVLTKMLENEAGTRSPSPKLSLEQAIESGCPLELECRQALRAGTPAARKGGTLA